ncbi:MAG: superoxide dismutase family protein [Lachnospiraceae bacterium]|nr:superoxide dismutase family protein [Lachnospiraceae bacterium]
MKIYSPQFIRLLREDRPEAVAWIMGNASHPKLGGIIRFYAAPIGGIVVNAEVFGLPDTQQSPSHFYAMHIHEVGDCTLPFDRTGSHYNPTAALHPAHAGDMPPLLGYNGYAWMSFYDARLTIGEILGKSIIIHGGRDDFTSQPAGDSGDKIGCGVIEASD